MLSVLIVCKKIDELLLRTIQSVEALKPQILVDISEGDQPLGIRKNRLIHLAAYEWVLVLDTDEVVSKQLLMDIKKVIDASKADVYGYEIPYINFVFNKVILYGGEKFAKIRLFRRDFGNLTNSSIHEEVLVSSKTKKLNGVIYHNSYRTIQQILFKFTKYAWQMAGEKRKAKERVTIKKLFLYGPHMIWARAVMDEGWRDGWRGIVLALCFGYMETMIYWFLLWQKLFP